MSRPEPPKPHSTASPPAHGQPQRNYGEACVTAIVLRIQPQGSEEGSVTFSDLESHLYRLMSVQQGRKARTSGVR